MLGCKETVRKLLFAYDNKVLVMHGFVFHVVSAYDNKVMHGLLSTWCQFYSVSVAFMNFFFKALRYSCCVL